MVTVDCSSNRSAVSFSPVPPPPPLAVFWLFKCCWPESPTICLPLVHRPLIRCGHHLGPAAFHRAPMPSTPNARVPGWQVNRGHLRTRSIPGLNPTGMQVIFPTTGTPCHVAALNSRRSCPCLPVHAAPHRPLGLGGMQYMHAKRLSQQHNGDDTHRRKFNMRLNPLSDDYRLSSASSCILAHNLCGNTKGRQCQRALNRWNGAGLYLPPPPPAQARLCLSMRWAFNRRFQDFLAPLFVWSRL